MTMRHIATFLLIATSLLTAAGTTACGQTQPATQPAATAAAATQPAEAGGSAGGAAGTAATTRPSELPGEKELITPNAIDKQAAATFASDPAIRKAIEAHLGNPKAAWSIHAARPVGDYVLLWIRDPAHADGGYDLVYSTRDQKIGWTFFSGFRG